MNLHNLNGKSDKSLDIKSVHNDKGSANLIRIKSREILEDHQSASDALLVLLEGSVIYQEADRSVELENVHDFVKIPAHVTHHLRAHLDSLLLLIH